MKTNIIVKLQYEALHNWPGVESALPNNPEIHFLKDKHRHVFYVTIEKSVTHSDRDVEIILFKKQVLDYLDNSFKRNTANSFLAFADLEYMSCEMLAERLLTIFECESVEVLEDNENGAKVYK